MTDHTITDPGDDSPGLTANRIAVCLLALMLATWLAWLCAFSPTRLPFIAAHFAALVPVLLLADSGGRAWLQRRLPAGFAGGAVIWLVMFVLTMAIGAPDQRVTFDFLGRWGLYFAIPILVFALTSGSTQRILGTAAIAIPVGMLSFPQLTAPGLGTFSFGMVLVLDLALLLVFLYRPQEDIHYALWLPWREARAALGAFLVFAAVALPAALLLGFVRYGLGEPTAGTALTRFLQIYVLIALTEELVFRGMLQSGLERVVGNRKGLVITAIIFGLAHIGHPPAPNWSYVALATGAGLVYGWVFQKTRNIAASALTHALVDWTWFVFFAGMIGK